MNWIPIDVTDTAILLGEEHTGSGDIAYSITDNSLAALTCGLNTKPHGSGRDNEDSIGFYSSERISIAVVADSHFGGFIADMVVKTFVQAIPVYLPLLEELLGAETSHIYHSIGDTIYKRLRRMTSIINERYDRKDDIGETTAIVAIRLDNELFYFSIGDSMLYLKQDNKITRINNENFTFLTETGLDREYFDNLYSYQKLEGKYTLVLMTDGYPGKYGTPPPDPEVLGGLLDQDLKQSMENIMRYIFENGGEDNFGMILCSDH